MPTTIVAEQLVERLRDAPWRYGFLALMRRISANPAGTAVGAAQLPNAEAFSLGQKPSLIFAPSEVAEAQLRNGKLHIRLYGLGMLGPNGPLPIHVTEIAREREEQRGDRTLSSFLDIFQHRSLTLLYRAWASAQSTGSLDRPEEDIFSGYASSLSGHLQRKDRVSSFPEHARLSATPHLVSESRDPQALVHAVAHHFGVPVMIDEFTSSWVTLPSERHCRLGQLGVSASMGAGAILGEQVLDRRHRFCMVIGPLNLMHYQGFTPRGADLLRLVELVRIYLGLEFEWLLELQIEPQSVPSAALGAAEQLGWSSWLGQPSADAPIVGMRFEPERYMRQLRKDALERESQRGGMAM
ncbi:type VI secretion system baseplate subunit TssG [Caballeronia sp. RCC_10]|uniref:type VI secretion system baseplate subunit TssG n=1 Tax=Caballeronia sp. RCC_10 TaxID=3239227 RepID=UPI00352479D2